MFNVAERHWITSHANDNFQCFQQVHETFEASMPPFFIGKQKKT